MHVSPALARAAVRSNLVGLLLLVRRLLLLALFGVVRVFGLCFAM